MTTEQILVWLVWPALVTAIIIAGVFLVDRPTPTKHRKAAGK